MKQVIVAGPNADPQTLEYLGRFVEKERPRSSRGRRRSLAEQEGEGEFPDMLRRMRPSHSKRDTGDLTHRFDRWRN